MRILKEYFDRVFPIIETLLENDVNEADNIPKLGPKPKFSALEIITLNMVPDNLLIDSKDYLFKTLHREFGFYHLIERSVYNKRKISLSPLMEKV